MGAIDLIVERSKEKVNIINVAADSTTKVEFIAKTVINELQLKNVIIKYSGGEKGWIGDVPRFHYDTTKITKLGWTPIFTSNEAIQTSIKKEIQYKN